MVALGTNETASITLLSQVYVDAPPPVSVTLAPAQTVAELLVAMTTGNGFTVIVIVAVFTQPAALVPVTV